MFSLMLLIHPIYIYAQMHTYGWTHLPPVNVNIRSNYTKTHTYEPLVVLSKHWNQWLLDVVIIEICLYLLHVTHHSFIFILWLPFFLVTVNVPARSIFPYNCFTRSGTTVWLQQCFHCWNHAGNIDDGGDLCLSHNKTKRNKTKRKYFA